MGKATIGALETMHMDSLRELARAIEGVNAAIHGEDFVRLVATKKKTMAKNVFEALAVLADEDAETHDELVNGFFTGDPPPRRAVPAEPLIEKSGEVRMDQEEVLATPAEIKASTSAKKKIAEPELEPSGHQLVAVLAYGIDPCLPYGAIVVRPRPDLTSTYPCAPMSEHDALIHEAEGNPRVEDPRWSLPE